MAGPVGFTADVHAISLKILFDKKQASREGPVGAASAKPVISWKRKGYGPSTPVALAKA